MCNNNEQAFTGTSFTVTHNLDRLNLDYRVACSGSSRPDLVQNILFSEGTERNSFDVYLTSYNVGTIQVLDTTRYPVNLPSPENNLKLVNTLENDYLLDIYQSGTTQLNETTYTTIEWDSEVILGSNYTLAGGGTDIIINSTGTYQITYNISIGSTDGSFNQRAISRSRLKVGGVEIPRSGGFGYHRSGTHGQGSISKTIITSLNVTEIVTLDSIKLTTQGNPNELSTIAGDSNITIIKLNDG